MIDWSSERLTENERLLFRRCSVFNGSFSLDAVTAVCGTPPLQQSNVVLLLSALIDKSLVHVADKAEGRYHLLDVVREYAKNLVDDPSESRELSHRHAEYYLTIARDTDPRLGMLSTAECLRRLKPDGGNFEAALTWTLLESGDPALGAELTLALELSAFSLDSYLRSRYWLERAVEMLDTSVSPDLFARLTFKLVYFSQMDGKLTKYIPNLEQAVSFYRRVDDPKGLAYALGYLALALATAEEPEQARATAREAVAVARKSSAHDLAWTLQNHAILEDSNAEKQRSLLMECLDLSRQDAMDTSMVMSSLGQAAFNAGDVDGALAWTRKGLDLFKTRSTVIPTSSAFYVANLAGYLLARGDVEEGIPVAQEALELSLQMGDPYLIAIIIQHLATASLLRGNATRAALLLDFVEARMRSANRVVFRLELHFRAKLSEMLAAALSETEREALVRTGGNWTEERAVEEARLVV
jgi:tetratricopeptide (TPR) repeat protein